MRFRGLGRVYDERLHFMSLQDAQWLSESLDADDVSSAWLVWSSAAEAALADASRFCGGPIPSRGFVLWRGRALFRVVRLGGHKVRKVRDNASDVVDGAGVFLYRDSSIAPLLDMRRRLKAVMDVLNAKTRFGISFARSVELTTQWDKILAVRPCYPVTGQWETSLEEFDHEVEGWLPLLPEVHLPRLTGQMLADVVQRKGATAGCLDGWEWRELKVLPVSWFDELARILSKVEDLGVWPGGLLDAEIAMIPQTDEDSTSLGQRPLSVLPIVYRVWASARMSQLGCLVQVLGP